jgi:hypothetical protein
VGRAVGFHFSGDGDEAGAAEPVTQSRCHYHLSRPNRSTRFPPIRDTMRPWNKTLEMGEGHRLRPRSSIAVPAHNSRPAKSPCRTCYRSSRPERPTPKFCRGSTASPVLPGTYCRSAGRGGRDRGIPRRVEAEILSSLATRSSAAGRAAGLPAPQGRTLGIGGQRCSRFCSMSS